MISQSELDTIRKRGYTDDEIWSKLSQSNPEYATVKDRGYSLDEVASKYKGGEQTNENAKSKSDQGTRSQGDAQRTLNGEVNATNSSGSEGGGELRPLDEGQFRSNDEARVIAPQGAKGGEQNVEGKTTEAENGNVPQVRKEDREGIPSQSFARNKAEVSESGVQPPAQGFFERLVTKAKEKPSEAAIVAAESGIGTAIDLAVGGSVATGVSALAEAGTFGVATPVVPAIAMAGMAGGVYVSSKIRKGIENLVGVGQAVEEAEQSQPELALVASIAAMVPQGAKSVVNLAGMGVKKALPKVALGAAGGAAFEPIRYGVESVGEKITGGEGPAPITLESVGESALFGAIMAGHESKRQKGMEEIANNDLPETSKVAGSVKNDQAIDETAKIVNLDEEKASQDLEKQVSEEEPRQTRIGAAAWKNERTGAIYHGEDHESAIEAARRDAQDPENKDKVAVGDLPKQDVTKPENRETPDFGFITKEGEFLSREEAQRFAEQSGQFKGKVTDRPVMHSNEVQLDFYEKKAPATEVKARQLPGAASKAQFTEDRLSQSVRAIEDGEKTKGRALDVNNEGDKREWIGEINKRFDSGTFSQDELNSLWNQSHEAYRIRNAAGRTIPIEKAVQQIGGERIQSQKALAAKNEEINKRREARGDAPLLPGREITQLGAWQDAAAKIAEDPQYLYNLTADLKKGKRSATAEESLALLQHRGEIENRIDDLSEQRNSETDEAKISLIDSKLEKEYNDLRDAEQVYRSVGTEVSAALRVRKIQALADFSLARNVAREEKAKNRKLTKQELFTIKEDSDKVKGLQQQISNLDNQRIEAGKDASIESETKQPVKKSKLTADQEIEKFLNKLDSGSNPAKLSSNMKKLATAIARKRLEETETKLGRKLTEDEAKQVTKPRDLTQATHDLAVKKLKDSWTIKDTRDAISGYGIYTNPDASALMLSVSRLTGENRQIGKIEDIIQGLAPKRTGKQRVKPDAGERSLMKRVNSLARKLGIKAKDPEAQLAGALESAKTRAKNLVEELEEIYLKGRPLNEETKAEIAKEDPELENLKGEIIGLRQLIEDTYGKREIPIEKKVKSLEKIYDNFIARYEKEIAAGEVYKTTSKGEKLTSEKLEQQRETLKNLRAERQHIRDADSLRQEALKVAKAEKRIAEISKILSGEMVDPKTGKNLAEGPETQRMAELKSNLQKLEGELQALKDSKKKSPEQKEIERLLSRLDEIDDQIAEGKRTEKKPVQEPLTPYAKILKDQIASANNQLADLLKEPAKTRDEKKVDSLKAQIEKAQQKLDDLQAGKTPETKSKIQNPETEEVARLQKEKESIFNKIKDFQESLKPTKEAREIERLQAAIDDVNDRISKGEKVAPTPKKEPLTAYAKKLKADLDAARKQYLKIIKGPGKTADEKLLNSLKNKKLQAEERLAKIQSEIKQVKGQKQDVLNEQQQKVMDEIREINDQIKSYKDAAKPPLKTDAEKREALLKRQIKNQKEILAKQEIKAKSSKVKPTSPRIEALEKELADLKDQTMSEDWYVARKEAIALQAYKNRINTQIEDAKRRLATGDFSKAEKKELKLDEEARQKKLELAELKDKIRQRITLAEWQNRPAIDKAIDATIKFKRAAVLSYLSTIGKLTAASFEIPLLRIPTAAAGKVLERTPFFKEIAQRARQEYGTPLDRDVAAYTKGLVSGWKEFSNIAFKLGRSELDLEYGDTSLIPLGALDVPGKIHEAIKNPTKKANYEMAFARYLQWAAREGLNIQDPVVIEKAGLEAYKEANASIFLQDNGLVNKYNLLVNKMKESDSWRQKTLARFLEFNIPIVRIPANIVKEALEYQFGFFTGTSKAIRMKMSKDIGKRLEDISPEDADLIMRQIKKGSVGLMAMAIGAALPDYFGGFYRKGAEKDEEEPEYGGIGPLPKTLLHHPAFVPFQIGATMRKVWDETMFDRATFGDDAEAISRGFAESQMGLLEELPFVNLSRNVGKYIDPSRISETAGEQAKSLIPGFIQETAKVLDVPEQDVGGALKTLFWDKKDVTKRKAETFLDHIYEGTPILREQVPEK